jgi:purine-binding chemotaxis protein CheW
MTENQDVSTKSLAGKYLTFHLEKEIYGLEIIKVQEIIKMMDVTRVPKTPSFVRGVINLRGKVIPVMDLRLKFEMESMEDTEKTCVIVVQVNGAGGSLTIGIIVDEVAEVADIAQEQIEPAPAFGSNVNTAFILGMGKIEKKVLTLLDIDKVLTFDEMAAVEEVT